MGKLEEMMRSQFKLKEDFPVPNWLKKLWSLDATLARETESWLKDNIGIKFQN